MIKDLSEYRQYKVHQSLRKRGKNGRDANREKWVAEGPQPRGGTTSFGALESSLNIN